MILIHIMKVLMKNSKRLKEKTFYVNEIGIIKIKYV